MTDESGGAPRDQASAPPRVFRKQAPEHEPVAADSMCLFRLGELCDHECAMCTNSGSPELRCFDEAELRRRADFLAEHGFQRVMLTGGEPTLHRFFWGLTDHLRSLEVAWDLNTHGGGFSRPERVARAVDSGLQRAIVSLHSHDPAISITMTGTTGEHHARTVQGIHNLRAAGVELLVNCVIARPNLGSMVDYLAWCRREFGADIALKLTFPNRVGRGADWEGIELRYSDVAEPIRAVAREAERLELDVSFESFPNCILGDAEAEEVGRLGFGETHYLDERTGTDILSIRWIDSQFKVYGEACTRCSAVDVCPGVFRWYAEVFGVGELMPFEV
jgi:molybdenum cofactor biosynthesis enzyme MoaA